MSIRYLGAAVLAAALVVTTAGVSAAQDAHEVRKGQSITLTTCVMPALDDDDEFVLTNIVASPAHPEHFGPVVYWLDDEDPIEKFAGRRVQFTAKIKDVDNREIEIKKNRDDINGEFIEIEGSRSQVKARPEWVGMAVPAGLNGGEVGVRTTLVKLEKVSNVMAVDGSCAAAAMASSELTLSVTGKGPAVAVAETAAVTETVAAAVTETAAAAATVTETPAAVVAETRVETPAPVVEREVEVETPAPPVNTERTELPRTATPLPLFALFGLGSLMAGTALRLRRR